MSIVRTRGSELAALSAYAMYSRSHVSSIRKLERRLTNERKRGKPRAGWFGRARVMVRRGVYMERRGDMIELARAVARTRGFAAGDEPMRVGAPWPLGS